MPAPADLANALLAALTEDTVSALVLLSTSGVVLYWNNGAGHLYGPPAATMLGRPLTARLPPGADPADLPGWTAFRAGQPFVGDRPDRRADAGTFWSHTRLRLLPPAAADWPAALLIARDIGPRRRAEEALRASEARIRAITTLSPDIISIIGADGRLIFNSEAARRIHGYDPQEMLGRSTMDYIHPEDLPGVQAAMARALSEPERTVTIRYRYRHADGSYTWMEAVGRNELGNAQVQGIVTLSREITAQIAAEQALRDSEVRYRLLFASNPHPMFVYDLETLRFLEANDTALAKYGYTRAEFLALTVRDIRPPEEIPHLLRHLEETRRAGHAIHCAAGCHHRLRGGTLIDVELTTLPIVWEGRGARLTLVQDVTERRRLEHKLRETQRLESLGVLAGGIAHDFNNLLTGIIGSASLVRDEVPADSPAGDSVRLIEETAHRAAELCRQMLAYSGRGRFIIRPIELSQFVRSTVELLKHAPGRNCRLSLSLADGLPPIQADTAQLQQVVMNLVINAAEAVGTREGLVRVATNLRHLGHDELAAAHLAPDLPGGDYVCLEVADNGCGMSPETEAKIFDPFFTTKFTGRGLGLAAVLGIMRAHRGAIRVESALNRGTTFSLFFPATSAVAPATAAVPDRSTGGIGLGRTILVVDDEAAVRAAAKLILSRHGFRTLLAEDGAEGLELFRTNADSIDCVLLDLSMPRLDGEAALRALRRHRPSARVVLMSGDDEREALRQFAGLDLNSFLPKPFTAEALLSKLAAVFAA